MAQRVVNTKIIAIANHKGGVTKTTTSINLADQLANLSDDNTVVLIDMDPQANASKHIVLEHPAKITFNLAELLLNPNADLTAFLFEQTQITGVTLIYGSLSLETVPDIIKQEDPRPNEVLKARIAPLIGYADYIILDCPPNLGLLTMNALAAATHYIIPVESGAAYGLYGLADLQERINRIKKINPELAFLGALLVKHDSRLTLCQDNERDAIDMFGTVVPVRISQTSKVNQSVAMSTSLRMLERNNKVTKQYGELAAYVAEATGGSK
jgi:chromosome partitioning protein